MERSLIESIRKRTHLYIGDTLFRGFRNILESILSDLMITNVNERKITIEFRKQDWIRLLLPVVDVDIIFDRPEDMVYIPHEKMGIVYLVALSEKFSGIIWSLSGGKRLGARNGIYSFVNISGNTDTPYTIINFKIDRTIFKKLDLNYEFINQRLREYAFLNPSSQITSTDLRNDQPQHNLYTYPRGVAHELDFRVATCIDDVENGIRLDLQTSIGKYFYQISFVIDGWLEVPYIATYANEANLIRGGSLESGILAGIQAVIKEIAERKGKKIKITPNELKKKLILIAGVRGEELMFAGSAKWELDMPAMQKEVKKYVYQEFLKYVEANPDAMSVLLERLAFGF
ncbi:hypothetical protein [Xanthocytophaga flava]|uniref:hypothetical protein n=1 Tax=Xanthocytophaga flava TaxID=3048013 RepID=UPI0028D6E1E3|nr:hypothetical protein [Xanthocytophaga flavus]MDJ1469861.1 hypothetical protein [Xanthocytophaga flavus]